MPDSISPTSGTTSPTATGGALPTRFNADALQRVWNGGAPISIGASGLGVKQLQAGLNDAGFSVGVADGAFGPKTEGALKAFQKSVNLAQTGKLDRATLQQLVQKLEGNRPAPGGALVNDRFQGNAQLRDVVKGAKVLGVGSRGDGVKAVQQALVDMGFSMYGGADGAYGAQSQKAVRNFQRNAQRMFPDVAVTGNVDAATLRALDALAPAKGKQGQSRNIPTPRYDGKQVRVVVVKSEHRTYLYDKAGKLQAVFGNAVGQRGAATDSGLKVVRTKLGESDARIAGKTLWDNPDVFGPRILDLSWADGSTSGEELHGTNAPRDLGLDVSHGCVRHANADIVRMFDALSVGDRVAIVDRIDDPRLAPPQR